MIQRWMSILIALMLASPAWGQQQDRIVRTEEELEKVKVEDATRAALDRKIPSVNFTDVRLRDAIDFLRDVSGANIHVNWRAIDKAGIDRDTTVNIHVKDVTLAKALSLILADATDAVELKWVFDQGVIEIAPADCFPERYFIKFTNVRDLADVNEGEEKAKELVEMICETIVPATWVQNGGKSTIRYFDGVLVVTTTQDAHDGIAALLKGFREIRAKNQDHAAAAKATTVAPATSGAKP